MCGSCGRSCGGSSCGGNSFEFSGCSEARAGCGTRSPATVRNASYLFHFAGGYTANDLIGTSKTVYLGQSLPGATQNSLTPIRFHVIKPRIATKLTVDVSTNSLNSPAVITVFKNGSATLLSVTIPAGGVGVFVDNTNSVVFKDGDVYDIALITSANFGVITLSGAINFTA